MDKKDERNSFVPLGTFRSSVVPTLPPPPLVLPTVPPPPPQAAKRAGVDETVKTRSIQSLAPGAPPVAEAARKRVHTLLGVPTPPEAFANAGKHGYPSPPKWTPRSQRDDELTQPDLGVAVPVARLALKSVGHANSGAQLDASGTPNISDAIQQMLDEQAAVSMEVDDEVALDLSLEAQMDPEPEVVPATRDAARRSSSPPVMLPGHVAAAHARETEQVAEQLARRSERPVPASAPVSARPLRDVSVTSLAPAEVRLRAHRNEAAPWLGFMMVAAMTLVFAGGWLLTAGSYKRQPISAAARVVQPVAPAAAAAPVVPPPQVLPTAPAPVPPAVVAAPVVPATPAPVPMPAAAPALRVPAPARAVPSVASDTRPPAVRPRMAPAPFVPAAPAPVGVAQPQAVVRITALGESPQIAEPAVTPSPQATLEILPEVPSRVDVLARLDALRPAVKACTAGRGGVADLDITIAGSGNITNVLVGGDYAGTPQGSCIARTVREAHFPRFTQKRFRLLYPYAL